MRRGARAALIGVLALLVPASPAELEAASSAWGPLPEELSVVMEAKARGYARRALGFSVSERVRDASYSGDDATRVRFKEYDYLLVRDGAGPEGFRAFRTRPGEKDEVRLDLPFPDAFLWTQLFRPGIRSTLRFSVGEWRTTPYRLAIPITWVTAAPVFAKRRITEWTGTVEVEYRTGNLVRVVAHPARQDERLKAELARYLTAFRFIGIPFAPPPIGEELIVDYDFEHEGYTYPTRIELLTFRLIHEDEREIVSRHVIEYGDYRFFGTQVRDEIPPLTWNTPEQLPKPTPRPPASED